MVNKETVLVLGAGASAPYGFPSGQRLADLICAAPRTTMDGTGISMQDYQLFKELLLRSGCSSVDAFLESRPEYLNIGKAAIGAILLPMEKTSNLFDKWAAIRLQPDISEEYRRNWPWYDLLLGILCNGVPFDEVGNNRLSVITFNYDRSLEHYLFTALKNRYGRPDDECAKVLGRIPILHVHGSLGKLQWQERANQTDDNVVPYDSGGAVTYIQQATKTIVILHEGTDSTPEFIHARELLRSAEQVFFLGFGYHRVNLARLGIGPTLRLPADSRGTALGLSRETREHFNVLTQSKRDPRHPPGQDNLSGGHILEDTDAYSLLHNHATFG